MSISDPPEILHHNGDVTQNCQVSVQKEQQGCPSESIPVLIVSPKSWWHRRFVVVMIIVMS
jgi:hypothetical protein